MEGTASTAPLGGRLTRPSDAVPDDRGFRLVPAGAGAGGLPLLVTIGGQPRGGDRNLVDAEAGYRLELGTTASIDVTGFVGRYNHLSTRKSQRHRRLVPSPRILVISQQGNLLEATTRGLEIAGDWMPVPVWRLDGSYTGFRVSPHLASASQDPFAGCEDGARRVPSGNCGRLYARPPHHSRRWRSSTLVRSQIPTEPVEDISIAK